MSESELDPETASFLLEHGIATAAVPPAVTVTPATAAPVVTESAQSTDNTTADAPPTTPARKPTTTGATPSLHTNRATAKKPSSSKVGTENTPVTKPAKKTGATAKSKSTGAGTAKSAPSKKKRDID